MESRSVTAWRAGAVAAALVAAGGGAALLAHPAGSKTADGGLSLSPVVIEQTAQAGAVTTVTVGNHSAQSLAVTVAARPWKQSVTGAAEPNRRATLSDIDVSAPDFTLKPHAQRTLTVKLAALPAAGYQYGALEVIGLPPDADTQKGVVTGYRLIGNLRMDPVTSVYKLSAGKVTTATLSGVKMLVLPVTNEGNTVKAVSGGVDLKGPLGTHSRDIASVRILPGQTVDVGLQPVKGLVAGAYKAKIELDQGTLTEKVTRSARIKKNR